MSPSPVTRGRANSQTYVPMNELKRLLESNKNEIIAHFQSQFDKINESMSALENRVLNVVDSIEKLNMDVSKLNTRVRSMEQDISEFSTASEQLFHDVMSECHQIELRKKNVVVSGLTEKHDGSLQERVNFDLDQCKQLLSVLKLGDLPIRKTYRIGKQKDNNKRLLKVEFCKASDKRALVQKSRELRLISKSPEHAHYANVFINPDQTLIQRMQAKKLRDEAKERRLRGEDVVIRYGKVVSRETTASWTGFHGSF